MSTVQNNNTEENILTDQKIEQEQVDDDGRRENQRVIEVEQRLRVKLIAQYAEMNKKKLELDHQALWPHIFE
ncbi:hypothetical protein HCN44_002183 [Aphidius gifuensis]|uniref:Uncharacterized protein n=1 Tax=Aphidius gifuensis TaxID=684658 RepID=A0A835CLZ1_APHGI|nr:hypothetical protein HCN44_002183 [Aphidius gifuensis]